MATERTSCTARQTSHKVDDDDKEENLRGKKKVGRGKVAISAEMVVNGDLAHLGHVDGQISERLCDGQSTGTVETVADLLVHDRATLHLRWKFGEGVEGVEEHR